MLKAMSDRINSLRMFHWVIVGVIAVSALTVASFQIAAAAGVCYPGTVMGRICYRGYFNNTQDGYGDSVLPIIQDGQALPSATVNSADSLYNVLRAAYGSGDPQRRTGAAFIYNTMMGNAAPGTGRVVSDAQWAELLTRLRALDQAGKIAWNVNAVAYINSFWQGPNTDDDAYYGEYKNEPGIIIRDYNNNIVYEILRRCANPVGDSAGLPAALNYTLTPNVNSVTPTEVEAGSKVSVTTSVNNTGDTTSDPSQWEITQINVDPGMKAPHEDEGPTVSGTAPCQGNGGAPSGNYFISADAECKNVAKGVGVFNVGSPSQNLKPFVSGIDIGDLPVGTRVCFALSVQPRSNTDPSWAHSTPICTVVGKKPKVQIWGGDISVRGKIETSTSVKDVDGVTRTFGSWVEYGGFAVGVIDRFASGSGLANQTDNNQVAWSKLTFANENQAGGDAYGQYTTLADFRSLPTIASYFNSVQTKSPVGAGSIDISNLAFDTGDQVQVRTAGDLTITGSSIPAGRSVVIVATGTVTIDGSITYANGPFGSINDIPQVVIVAQNINVRSGVGRVDAWLVASGTINTCSDFSGNLTSNKCPGLLEVNGPVVTNRLILNRTAGAGTGAQSGDPAER